MTGDAQPGANIRLGFLVPARNVTCEAEFTRAVPDGVSCHFSRLARNEAELTPESIVGMMASVEQAGALLSGAGLSVIAAACTSGSFLDGRAAGDALAAQASRGAGGVPAFTTTDAVEKALGAIGARTIFMLTPYPQGITHQERRYFEQRGFDFSGTDSFECQRSEEIRSLTSADVLARLLRNRDAINRADAVFVSCTNLSTMDRLGAMVAALGKPVISSNSATLWRALTVAAVPGRHDALIFA